jgi:hypothetical protein
MQSSKINLSGSKDDSNSKSKHKNHVVQLVCLGGLSTFIPFAPKLFKIHMLLEDEENELQPKKLKNNYNVFLKWVKAH